MVLVEIEQLVQVLFQKKWALLHKDALRDGALETPGVYLLAYPKQDINLVGENVGAEQIYYVGMTNSRAGLRGWLIQFMNAIEGKRGHSGGNTFFDHHKLVPYAQHKPQRALYFVTHPVDCCSAKKDSQPSDFREMGHVACLEYYAIAYVKQKTGRVPMLNMSVGGQLE